MTHRTMSERSTSELRPAPSNKNDNNEFSLKIYITCVTIVIVMILEGLPRPCHLPN